MSFSFFCLTLLRIQPFHVSLSHLLPGFGRGRKVKPVRQGVPFAPHDLLLFQLGEERFRTGCVRVQAQPDEPPLQAKKAKICIFLNIKSFCKYSALFLTVQRFLSARPNHKYLQTDIYESSCRVQDQTLWPKDAAPTLKHGQT